MSSILSPNSSLLISNPSFQNPNFKPVFLNPNFNFSTTPSHFPSPLQFSTPIFKPTTPISATTSDVSSTSFTPPPNLKTRLKNGDTLYGMFLCSFSPTLAEIAALSGYDFVVVDMEHGYGGIPEALTCLRALAASSTPAILRLPEPTAAWAKKALDIGPQGIMFPMIDTPELAREAVSFCRYPPNGVRGAAHQIVRASGYGIDAGYLNTCEEELLIMCQVESQKGVDNIKEIAAVEGVDCIQMGPTDLSASMGYLWDPEHRKVKEVMRKVEKKVLDQKAAYLCGFAMTHDSPEMLKARGYHMVSGAVDIALFRNAAVEDVKRFMMSKGKGEDGLSGEGEDDDEKYWSE